MKKKVQRYPDQSSALSRSKFSAIPTVYITSKKNSAKQKVQRYPDINVLFIKELTSRPLSRCNYR